MSPFFATVTTPTNPYGNSAWQALASNPKSGVRAKFKEITEHLQVELTLAQTLHQGQTGRERKPAPWGAAVTSLLTVTTYTGNYCLAR